MVILKMVLRMYSRILLTGITCATYAIAKFRKKILGIKKTCHDWRIQSDYYCFQFHWTDWGGSDLIHWQRKCFFEIELCYCPSHMCLCSKNLLICYASSPTGLEFSVLLRVHQRQWQVGIWHSNQNNLCSVTVQVYSHIQQEMTSTNYV